MTLERPFKSFERTLDAYLNGDSKSMNEDLGKKRFILYK